MAITPTNSLLTALSGLGIDGTKPRPAPDAARPQAPAAAQPKAPQAVGPAAGNQVTGPEPSRSLPRGSLVNIVI
jgi:hypothetical protein